ncbi:LysR family transcriptional regulator [Microbacterium sp. Sa4CUA7]|uniref:LysR family transcriptional regulator n=1 Tax=Microbacterium pullorum TaxID=2762236 RepID=A0ABR8S2Z8_9MICO|nr:LysR substrate-binding domain-containing protein [Microbacterium pullorum]MBD7957739.1 LysR family transcriptional regulator [Microbacterium pullorum]
MDIRQLRYFVAVADELHFGRAAERLHMSQPPLSVQIGHLEREIGVKLLERSTRQVTLTAAGRHLQQRARVLLADLESVRTEMRDYADGLSGELAAGFVSSANYTVLPDVVRLFRSRRASVELNLAPLTSGEQISRVLQGDLDVGIVRDEVPAETAGGSLVAEVVFEERLVACLPVSHPLARVAEITPAQLIGIPLIAYPRSLMPGYVDRVATIFADLDDAPRIVEVVVHQETALAFVAAGAGASVLPESVRQLVPPSIAVVPLAGSPTTRLLAIRPRRPRNAAVTATFITCLHEAAAAIRARSLEASA